VCLLYPDITMVDNKTPDIYSTTDIRPVCRRATSIYIYRYFRAQTVQTDVRLGLKQSQKIFSYPMLAHNDRRKSQLMWKLQWRWSECMKCNRENVRGFVAVKGWSVRFHLYLSLDNNSAFLTFHFTTHFTEMSKELWTCPYSSIAYSQAKFALMC
jgi:hypothetical protein